MFYSFEGIDGSGKSTQARLLVDALRERGHQVIEVREPGGTALGERVRDLLLNPRFQICSRAELLLFSAARAQLVANVIEPALALGSIVVADRFFDSSTAYQGGGRGLTADHWMTDLHSFATAGRAPDRTYLIDVPTNLATTRRESCTPDRIEQSGHEYYERVRQSYLEIAKLKRVLTLDGSRTREELHDAILRDVLTTIK